MPSKSASGILEEDVPGRPNKRTQRRANGQDGRCDPQAGACNSAVPTAYPAQCLCQAQCTVVACQTGAVP